LPGSIDVEGRVTPMREVNETAELKQYPSLHIEGGNPSQSMFDRYDDAYLRKIGNNVSTYVNVVCSYLRNTISKSIVHCQV